MSQIYIFGAHSRARTLAVYLKALQPELSVAAFLYDNDEKNPEEVEGVPVARLDSGGLCAEWPVYLGIRGVFHEKTSARLRELGFRDIRPVTAAFDMELRNAYLRKHFTESGRPFVKIDDLDAPAGKSLAGSVERAREVEVCAPQPARDGALRERAGAGREAAVYVAQSAFDGPLRTPFAARPYERMIQAGASLTEERLPGAVLTDDQGEGISERNRQFCELTALYWVWRNAQEEIVGLEHYRRRFLLPEDWRERMSANGVDVILPVPLYVAPSVAENYKERHDGADWERMLAYLGERDPKERAAAEAFFAGGLYSPCNMLIARKPALDALCAWMFPILFAVANQSGEKEDSYQNRYPGFLSERLISFYFERNRERYKLVYADKNFLG